MKEHFDYDEAFSRNLGWFQDQEQRRLRNATVAIAGCGGVGGIHAQTIARLGIGGVHLADFDTFGIENFNRQVGATMHTVGASKLEVTASAVRAIQPDGRLRLFPEGIHEENVDAFLDGAELYIDGLDFFAMDARRLVFSRAFELGIPAITAAPLGMGTSMLCFLPGSMSFEDYFGMEGRSPEEQYLRFYVGLAPEALHGAYLVDPSRFNVEEKRGPSTIIGCTMAASLAATAAVKLLLKRGEVFPAPKSTHWDPYLQRAVNVSLPGGHSSPEFQQRLERAMAQLSQR